MRHAAGRSGATRRARSAGRRSAGAVPAGWEELGVDATDDAPDEAVASAAGRRVRTAGGLLTALARAGDPEDLLRLILERSNGLSGRAAELPEPARDLVRRIAREGDPEELTSPRGRSGSRRTPETRTITRFRTVVRNTSASAPSLRSLKSGPEPSERGVDGMGASGVMKLAGKLMKLIHLAEVERRKADAQRQVRMAENSAEARSEGAGQPGGESINEKATNIKQLQQEVLQAVLRELEMMRWRREDSDGPNSWC
jgi:hypothetical protein